MFRPGPPTDERELPRRFRFAGLEVDVPAARVYRGGAALAVEPRAFDVLLLLAANPGRVVGKEEIFARLWGGAFVTDGFAGDFSQFIWISRWVHQPFMHRWHPERVRQATRKRTIHEIR